jgi:tetrahydromethanopterin S-methyltransferase subunit B
MKGNRIIETMGTIAKVEKLETLSTNILENTLVLDQVESFPGYHGSNLPSGYYPNTVYLILKKKLSAVKTMRITQKIRKSFKHPFDGTSASVCIQNDTLPCIRIRNLQNYNIIPELQKCYLYEGVTFMKKKNISGDGIIEITKHFELEELENGIFKDLEDPLMYYVQIPSQLSWHIFVEITVSIRRRIDKLNFDAALGVVYLKEICDVVRIFAKDMYIEDLRMVQGMYIEEIKKY